MPNTMTYNTVSPIRRFYGGKNVFITGATGTLGTCIVEKLLRAIPELGTLYLLFRAKDGESVEERFEKFQQNSVFQRWQSAKLERRFAKIIPIEGDVGQEHLGISPANRQLLITNVNVVIHAAATPLLCPGLRETIEVNVLGTRGIVDLCRQMVKLKSLVHVSSAYANAHLTTVEEVLYPSDDPQGLIEMTKLFDDYILKSLEKGLIKQHPNTYTYTRHMAEHEVAQASTHFPCGIVRPSIVTPAWQEPVSGWFHSETGLPVLIRDSCRGIIKRLPLDISKVIDFIPVDVVANAVIAMGQHLDELKVQNDGIPEELKIIHLTSSSNNPCRFEALHRQINKSMHQYPVTSAVWYPKIQMVNSWFWFRLSCIVYHFMPALVLDLVTLLTGRKPHFVSYHLKLWQQIVDMKNLLFTEWHFNNQVAMNMSDRMDPLDRLLFPMDVTDLKWTYYFFGLHTFVRAHLNSEPPQTLEAARIKHTLFYYINVGLRLAIYYGIYKFLAAVVGSSFFGTVWLMIFTIPLLNCF